MQNLERSGAHVLDGHLMRAGRQDKSLMDGGTGRRISELCAIVPDFKMVNGRAGFSGRGIDEHRSSRGGSCYWRVDGDPIGGNSKVDDCFVQDLEGASADILDRHLMRSEEHT